MTDPDQVWGPSSRDPRVAEHAQMRVSDADRDVVPGVLAEAYADGRIDREEPDARGTGIRLRRDATVEQARRRTERNRHRDIEEQRGGQDS